MNASLYVGLDVHKKSISWCAKRANGALHSQGKVAANRRSLSEWAGAGGGKKARRLPDGGRYQRQRL